MKKIELVAPAGNFEKLNLALHYGADAVYLGGENFNLRLGAGNFTIPQLKEARKITNDYQAKMYVTVNSYVRNEDLNKLPEYLAELKAIKVDALIISDLGVFSYAKEYAQNIPVIISTQANTTNWKAVQLWESLGVEKICLARELTIEEIRQIRRRTSLKLEVFVHGSMCMAYSGRCLLSAYFTGRNGNLGNCNQPCRWKYLLLEVNEVDDKKHQVQVEEDKQGTYFLNAKDLCMIDFLPELIESGIDMLKIEGRTKSSNYVAVVTKVYREAIDTYYDNPDLFICRETWRQELLKLANRGYTTGFYFTKDPFNSQLYNDTAEEMNYEIVAIVKENLTDNQALVEVKNQIKRQDFVEVMTKAVEIKTVQIKDLKNEVQMPVEVLNPGERGFLITDGPLERMDIVRKFKD